MLFKQEKNTVKKNEQLPTYLTSKEAKWSTSYLMDQAGNFKIIMIVLAVNHYLVEKIKIF